MVPGWRRKRVATVALFVAATLLVAPGPALAYVDGPFSVTDPLTEGIDDLVDDTETTSDDTESSDEDTETSSEGSTDTKTDETITETSSDDLTEAETDESMAETTSEDSTDTVEETTDEASDETTTEDSREETEEEGTTAETDTRTTTDVVESTARTVLDGSAEGETDSTLETAVDTVTGNGSAPTDTHGGTSETGDTVDATATDLAPGNASNATNATVDAVDTVADSTVNVAVSATETDDVTRTVTNATTDGTASTDETTISVDDSTVSLSLENEPVSTGRVTVGTNVSVGMAVDTTPPVESLGADVDVEVANASVEATASADSGVVPTDDAVPDDGTDDHGSPLSVPVDLPELGLVPVESVGEVVTGQVGSLDGVLSPVPDGVVSLASGLEETLEVSVFVGRGGSGDSPAEGSSSTGDDEASAASDAPPSDFDDGRTSNPSVDPAPSAPVRLFVMAGGGTGAFAGLLAQFASTVPSLPGMRPIALSGVSAVRGSTASRGWVDRLRYLFGVGGYSQYDDSDPLEHDARAALHDRIAETPGTNLSTLAARAGLPLSTARYHLQILENEGLVVGVKVRGRRRYLPAGFDEPKLAAALADDHTRALIAALDEHGTASVSRLAGLVERDPSTVTHHLQRLADDGIVRRERTGRVVVNCLTPAARRVLDGSRATP